MKNLWGMLKLLGFLHQREEPSEATYKSKDCDWKIEVKSNSQANVHVHRGTLRCLVLSDIHSPFFYPPAVSLALKIGLRFNPHLLVLNGDIVDCFSVSPYRWGPRKDNLQKEIEVSRELLKFILSSFPRIPCVYLEGNHELFLQKYICSKASALADLAELHLPNLLGFVGRDKFYLERKEEYAIYSGTAFPTLYFYDKTGSPQLLIIHGDGMGISKGAVHYARLLLQRTNMNTICGHWHVGQTWHTYALNGNRISAWVSPPLSFPRPHWRNSVWGLGFIMFSISDEGLLTVDMVDFVLDAKQGCLVAKYGNMLFTEELGEDIDLD